MSIDPTLILTIVGNLLVIGIAWGSLHQRVKSLEREAAALAKLPERLTRIEEQTGFANKKLDQIVGSWLFREPPGYEVREPPPSRRRPVTDKDGGR